MTKIIIKHTISASPTVAINSLVQKKIAGGEKIYNLGIGEPMVATHPLIIEAAEKAMWEGKTHYSPAMGIMELRNSASAWMNRTYQTSYSTEETLVTAGGKFGLYALCRALLDTEDEGIIIAPYWVSYPSLISMTGAKVKTIETSEQSLWKVSAEQLRASITPATKIIFFNNAANPTGVLYSRDEIRELISIAHEKNILFISDEVYSGLTYSGEFVSAGSFPEYRGIVVVVQSVSKHFAMTGWRVGFVFGSPELLKVLGDWQSQSTSGASTISQWAAVAAFQNAEHIIDTVKIAMKKRRDVLSTVFEQMFGIRILPDSGLYAFVSLKNLGSEEKDSMNFCRLVLEKANVALIPGSAFGAEGYVRLSFGGEEGELEKGVRALADYLKK